MKTMFGTHKVIINNKLWFFLCEKKNWILKLKQISVCITTKISGPLWVNTYKPSSTPYFKYHLASDASFIMNCKCKLHLLHYLNLLTTIPLINILYIYVFFLIKHTYYYFLFYIYYIWKFRIKTILVFTQILIFWAFYFYHVVFK